jgi:protoheme IX farnesyltransferase
MTTTRPRPPRPATALDRPATPVDTPAPIKPRLRDYTELTKPRIGAMALITVAVGYLMGAAPAIDWLTLSATLVGAGLVAAGGSALNCVWERKADLRMTRTANRAVPAGRIPVAEAGAFGAALTFLGTGLLVIAVPHWQAAAAAFATFALYVFVYTPLKSRTAWNTVIGAIPGALSPVIGWCAARGNVTAEGLSLFGILFAWQLPHFYSIAWMHRADYARGGMKMLPVIDTTNGVRTGQATVASCLLLLALAVVPFVTHAAGAIYLAGSTLIGLWFLARCVTFATTRDDFTARRVLRGSLVYLVAVMALLVADGVVPKLFAGAN